MDDTYKTKDRAAVHYTTARMGFILASVLISLLILAGCKPPVPAPEPSDQPLTAQPAPSLIVSLSPTIFNTPTVSATSSQSVTPIPTAIMPGTIRQGALFSNLSPYQVEEVATGDYQPDNPTCGETYLNTLSELNSEILLTLTYSTPVVPDQIEVYTGDGTVAIKHIELLNSVTGLGRLIYEGEKAIGTEPVSAGACTQKLILPADIDFEVDTIIISFHDLASAAQLGAVELLGHLEKYTEPAIYWRVPLPEVVVDLSVNQSGIVYLSDEANGLFAYDVEGNQLKAFSVPDHAAITSVASDPAGNLVLTDSGFGWFVKLSPEGYQLSAGGDGDYYEAAVNPLDGSLYLLHDNSLSLFNSDTAEFIRQIEMEEQLVITSLSFNNQGQLYALCHTDYPATLIELDTSTGEELDTILLGRSNFGEIIARDLAIDGSDNFYVLFSNNTAQIAVHMLDKHGSLVKRFGTLSTEYGSWAEAEFFDPRAITVTGDGRFIIIGDGHEDSAFLTAYLIEIE